MEIKPNDILKSGNQEFTKVLSVRDRGLYGITGWVKSREVAEEAQTVETNINKHGLRYANAEVVGNAGDSDQDDSEEQETSEGEDENEEDEDYEDWQLEVAEEFDVDPDEVREMTKTDLRDMSADNVYQIGEAIGVDTEPNKPKVVENIAEELDL